MKWKRFSRLSEVRAQIILVSGICSSVVLAIAACEKSRIDSLQHSLNNSNEQTPRVIPKCDQETETSIYFAQGPNNPIQLPAGNYYFRISDIYIEGTETRPNFRLHARESLQSESQCSQDGSASEPQQMEMSQTSSLTLRSEILCYTEDAGSSAIAHDRLSVLQSFIINDASTTSLLRDCQFASSSNGIKFHCEQKPEFLNSPIMTVASNIFSTYQWIKIDSRQYRLIGKAERDGARFTIISDFRYDP